MVVAVVEVVEAQKILMVEEMKNAQATPIAAQVVAAAAAAVPAAAAAAVVVPAAAALQPATQLQQL